MTRHASLSRASALLRSAWHRPAVRFAGTAPTLANSRSSDDHTELVPEWRGWSVREAAPGRPGPRLHSHATGWATRDSFLGARHPDLPVGSFVSWGDNPSTARSAFIDITHSFVVTGTATVRLTSDVLLQSDAPHEETARQTLHTRLVDPYAGSIDLGALTAVHAPRPLPGEQHLVTWAPPAVDLVLLGDSSTARTVEVVHTLELHPALVRGGCNDRIAILPPRVTAHACGVPVGQE